MYIFPVLKSFLRARKISAFSREKVLRLQQKRLRQTLLYAYDHSPFYRDLWKRTGIKRDELATIPLARLPIVDKRQLMEAFEQVITLPDITKENVEEFIDTDPGGAKLYRNKYIALNTSGSSGYIGIFLFTKKFWHRLIGSLWARLLRKPLTSFLRRKTRLAFMGEATGHHAGASLIRSAPALLFKTLSISVGSPEEKINRTLNAFQPHMLSGYASALAHVAEARLHGSLRIKPEIIISSGEPLTALRQEQIRAAFDIPAFDLYGATECLSIGVDVEGVGVLNIFDDVLFLEVVDDRGNPVANGKAGRVVITVFGNDIQPLVRYLLDDEITINPGLAKHSPFTQVQRVTGRSLERMIFKVRHGSFELHPMEMIGFFFPGLRHYQLQQNGPRSARLRIVAEGNREKIHERIKAMLASFLKEKRIPKESIDLTVEFVNNISPDPKTGKTPIMVPWKE